jgi:hypothetical protein
MLRVTGVVWCVAVFIRLEYVGGGGWPDWTHTLMLNLQAN